MTTEHPPVPDNAPYIGDIVQGSTSVPLPSTFTGDVDPAQIGAPVMDDSGSASAIRQVDGLYWYYVRIDQIDQGWRVPVRETIMTSSVDVHALLRSLEQDQAKLDTFKGALIRCLRIEPTVNVDVNWESLPCSLATARPYRFTPPTSHL